VSAGDRRRGRATIGDVASDAGVSVATVSNVLNRPEVVAAPTLERVNLSIARVGFVRNEAARQLRAGGSSLLALLIFDVRNPFWLDIARGVEDVASDAGRMVILCSTDGLVEKSRRYIDLLSRQVVQGMLVPSESPTDEEITAAKATGAHVVAMGLQHAETDVCSVASDDHLGGDLAMTHLLSRGHRRIWHVTGSLQMVQCTARLEGARTALDRFGGAAELTVLEMDAMTVEQGRRAGEQLLTAPEPPTAVFCGNDVLALGIEQVLLRSHLRIPQDVAIVGYDDIELAAAAGVPITSVHQSGYQVGRTAATLLLDEIAAELNGTPHVHQHRMLRPTLTERQST
jgi:LacI family transcriptional regulator